MKNNSALIAGGELIEAISDNLLLGDYGLLKDIPVFGTILGAANVYSTLKSRMFEKKIHAFLYEFNAEELSKFKKIINKKTDEDLGFEVLNVIDNVDKINQVQMIARATKQYVRSLEVGENPKNIFDHNIHVIKNLDNYLISGMHAIYSGQASIRISYVDQALFNLGLVNQKNEPALAAATSYPALSFVASVNGEDFYKSIIVGE
uniref:hypothetical protein n=1 Tax=Psychrobacter sp. TaxID=56811 RepID=UPI00159A9A47|nr:hypothetical protein [Psychrobacter sp.]QJS05201.1 hypothetical protein [Psychrobacter sp.]